MQNLEKSIPKWIYIYVLIVGLMSVALSFTLIGSEGLAFAARNIAMGVTALYTVYFFKKSVPAFTLILIARTITELGDLAYNFTDSAGVVGIGVFSGIMLVIDLFALFTLVKK